MKKLLFLATLMAMQFASAESVLRRGNGAEPKSIDPHVADGMPESVIIYDLFEGLIGRGRDSKLVPALAESWTISDDGKTYTFKLRDATWSDNTPITAHTFVQSWKRFLNPESASDYAFILAPVKNAEALVKGELKDVDQLGIKAIDDKTVEITLENPTPYFLTLLSHSTTYAVPMHVIEKHGKNWTRPENIVTSAAYTITEWQPNSRLVAEKSKTYWDKDNVKIDKVIFYPIEDANSELKRYRSDELAMTYDHMTDEEVKWGRENLPEELKIDPQLSAYYYGFNLTKPPFKDNPKLRKALSLAINRNVITEKVTGSGELPSYSIVPPVMTEYQSYIPDYATLKPNERVEMAKKLYEEAGYSKDNPAKIEILYNTSENHKKIAIAVAAMWKQVLGVETTMRNEEWKVFLQSRRNQNMQIYRAGWHADYNDPYTFLEIYSSVSSLNDSKFNNSEFDELLKKSSQESDPTKRNEILRQAEKIMIDDAAIIPIMTYSTKRFIKPYVKGYVANPNDDHLTKYLSIEK